MGPLVDVQCPHCQQPSRLEYVRLGSTLNCAACGQPGAPQVPVGASYPVTQWELTFKDFLSLLGEQTVLRPRLQAWFGHALEAGPPLRIVDSNGAQLDPLAVHLAIQADPTQQHALYQAAMSLWR